MSLVSKAACLALLTCLSISIAEAQIETGTIVGVVQDSTGGVVPTPQSL